MRNEFCIISFDASIANKQITILTNFRVDETSVNRETVRFVNLNTGLLEPYTVRTDDKYIIIDLTVEPKLNTRYMIQVADIKDMLNRPVNNPFTRDVMFEQSIKSKLKVLAPNQNHAFRTNIIEIEIDVISEENENLDYCYEISSDVAFFNVVQNVKSEKQKISVTLEDGQYYFRVRAVNHDDPEDFTVWTDMQSFVVLSTLESHSSPANDFIEEIIEPIEFFYTEESKPEITDRVKNGYTVGKSFAVMFSRNIHLDYQPEEVNEEGLIKIGEVIAYKEEM